MAVQTKTAVLKNSDKKQKPEYEPMQPFLPWIKTVVYEKFIPPLPNCLKLNSIKCCTRFDNSLSQEARNGFDDKAGRSHDVLMKIRSVANIGIALRSLPIA